MLARKINIFILFLILGTLNQRSYGQCKEFIPQCKTKLESFTTDGNFYRVQLFEGEYARLNVVLYSGMVYRIIPCASDGKVSFDLFDPAGVKLLSTNNKKNNFWDVIVGATGKYTVVARQRKEEGCVSVIVGYMKTEDYEKKYNLNLQ